MSWDPAYLVGGGGLLAAIGAAVVSFRKAGPEASQIIVDASKDVVIIQKGMIDELREGLRIAQLRISELQTLEGEVAQMRDELHALRAENQHLRDDNRRLRRRLSALESTD